MAGSGSLGTIKGVRAVQAIASRTILVTTDIEGSTPLAEQAGAAWGDILRRHDELSAAAFEASGGQRIGDRGDGFVWTLFDVDDAVRASSELMTAMAAEPWPEDLTVRARVGIHSGAVSFDPSLGHFGLDIHVAARVGDLANGGRVVLSDVARRRSALPPERFEVIGSFDLRGVRAATVIHAVKEPGATTPATRVLPRTAPTFPSDPPLVGRGSELAWLRSECEIGGSVISVCGPGGVGKTRLARELVATAGDRPVHYVDLSAVESAKDVPGEIARQLGHSGSDPARLTDLAPALARSGSLLVLDNLEQVIGIAPDLAELARPNASVTVVSTSRVELNVLGERVLALSPLAGGIRRQDAQTLFGWLARRSAPDVQLDEQLVAEICERLDGFPLALVLAAGRLRVLTLADLLDQLDSSIDVLTSRRRDVDERQSSIVASVRWSRDLLDDEAVEIFEVLAELPGGAERELLARVTDIAAPGLLSALDDVVDHQLVQVVDDGPARRFVVPRLVREAMRRIVEPGRSRARRRRVVDAMRQGVRSERSALFGPEQDLAYRRFVSELENHRVIGEWVGDDDALAEPTIRLATDLGASWWQAHTRIGLDLLTGLADGPAPISDRSRSAALATAAVLASYDGRGTTAEELARTALVANAELPEIDATRTIAIEVLAAARSAAGDGATALALVGEAQHLLRAAPEERWAVAGVNLGNVLLAEGVLDEAEELYHRSLRFFRSAGDRWLIAAPLARLGDLELRRGDLEVAGRLLGEAVTRWRDGPSAGGLARAVGGLGRLRLIEGDTEQAVGLARESFAWARSNGLVGETPWSLIVRAATLADEDPDAARRLVELATSLASSCAQPVHGVLGGELAPFLDAGWLTNDRLADRTTADPDRIVEEASRWF